jgi:hypothetical protein
MLKLGCVKLRQVAMCEKDGRIKHIRRHHRTGKGCVRQNCWLETPALARLRKYRAESGPMRLSMPYAATLQTQGSDRPFNQKHLSYKNKKGLITRIC